MTNKQYDTLITRLSKLEETTKGIVDYQIQILNTLSSFNDKTIVVSDVNKEIEKLKTDIKSLKDEEEM